MRKAKTANSGITLIALVVTIIVLIILASISIVMLLGNDGIIMKAEEGSVNTAHAEIGEFLKLEYLEYTMEIDTNVKTTYFQYLVNEAIINENGVVNVEKLAQRKSGLGTGDIEGNSNIYVLKTEDEEYKLNYYDDEGTEKLIEVIPLNEAIDWNTIIKNAKVHEDQDPLNNDIGIGTDGKPVNLDLWKYYEENGEIHLGKVAKNTYSSDYYNGYIGDYEVNGEEYEIIGKMPQYIKINGVAYPVVHLDVTFKGLTDLTKAPEIPTTVKTMYGTFYNCESLTETPFIPDGVIDFGMQSYYASSSVRNICRM